MCLHAGGRVVVSTSPGIWYHQMTSPLQLQRTALDSGPAMPVHSEYISWITGKSHGIG